MLGMNAVPAHAETIRVTIDKLVFSPAEINAKVGDTIEWVNQDILAHTANVAGDWDVTIPAGATARVDLKKAGSVEFFCRYHPSMKGRIAIAPEWSVTRLFTASCDTKRVTGLSRR
jgi:plastocyanin